MSEATTGGRVYALECAETGTPLGTVRAGSVREAAFDGLRRTRSPMAFIEVRGEVRAGGGKPSHYRTWQFLVTRCGRGFVAVKVYWFAFGLVPGDTATDPYARSWMLQAEDAWSEVVRLRAAARRKGDAKRVVRRVGAREAKAQVTQ